MRKAKQRDGRNRLMTACCEALESRLLMATGQKLVITGPSPIVAVDRQQYTVTLRDLDNNLIITPTDLTITLGGAGTEGSFYTVSDGGSPTATTVLPAGQSSTTYWYQKLVGGSTTHVASTPNTTSGTRSVSVTGFNRRIRLSFDNAANPEDLQYFPLTVRLTPDRVDYSKFRAGGPDIRFVDPDGTSLRYQMLQWESGGESIVRVWVPQVNGSSSADSIALYYGHATAPNRERAALSSNGLMAFYEFEETPVAGTASILDTSELARHATPEGSFTAADLQAQGVIGSALRLGQANDPAARLNTNVVLTSSAFSLAGGLSFDKLQSSATPTIASVEGRWSLYADADGRIRFSTVFPQTGPVEYATAPGAIEYAGRARWTSFLFSWDSAAAAAGGGPTLYLDDNRVFALARVSGDAPAGDWGMAGNDKPLLIGNRSDNQGLFRGAIDELQINSVALSANWYQAWSRSYAGLTVRPTAGPNVVYEGQLLPTPLWGSDSFILFEAYSPTGGTAPGAWTTEWDLSYDGVNFHADATGALVAQNGPATYAGWHWRLINNVPTGYSNVFTIANVAPSVNAGSDVTLPKGSLNGTGSFSDPGVGETYAGTVDYGDGAGPQPLALEADKTFHLSHQYQAAGQYTVTVTIDDGDGGITSDTFIVTTGGPNVEPVAHAGGPYAIDEGQPLTLSAALSFDADGDPLVFWWDVNGDGIFGDAVGVNPTLEWVQLAALGLDGTWTGAVTVRVDDLYGGISTAQTTLTVANVAPAASVAVSAAPYLEASSISVTISASDAGGDPLSHFWTVSQNGSVIASGSDASFTFTPPDDGALIITVTVSDDDGGSAVVTRQLEVQNVAPTGAAVVAPAGWHYEGTPLTLTGSASDVAGASDPLVYSWNISRNGVAGYATGVGANFTFTPGDEGTYVANLTVSDGDGGTATATSAPLNVLNVRPAISVGGPATVGEGGVYAVDLLAVDPGDDAIQSWFIDWGDGSDPDSDGTVGEVVAGSATSATHVYATAGNYTVVVRAIDDDGTYGGTQPPGTLDTSFGTGGKVQTNMGSYSTYNDVATATVVQPDGKIILAGYTDFGPALARYTTTGQLDSTFGVGGKVLTDVWYGGWVHAMACQADGKIVIIGSGNSQGISSVFILRYHADGSLDQSFGSEGLVVSNLLHGGTGVVVQPNGKLVIAGPDSTGLSVALARFNPDGTVDTSFGSGGVVTAGGGLSSASATALQADGRLLVAGSNGTYFGVLRYNGDGTLDTSFGAGGLATTDLVYGNADAIAVQPDGKVLVAGDYFGPTGYQFAVLRFTAGGALDPAFDGDGVATSDSGGASSVGAVLVQADGGILVAGTAYVSLVAQFVAIRFSSTGALDPTFGSGGRATVAFTSFGASGQAAALTPDGKLVFAGKAAVNSYGTGDFAVARLHAEPRYSTSVTVTNAAPAVSAGADLLVPIGVVLGGGGSFADTGVGTWSATIDYGDGSGVQPLTLGSDRTFQFGHAYAAEGTYTLTVTVSDGRGGVGTDTVQVSVVAAVAGLAAAPGASYAIVDDGQGTQTLVVSGGTVQVTADQHLAALTVAGGSILDLDTYELTIDYTGTSPADLIRTYLTSGYAGGAWNGSGICSSTASAAGNTALGYRDDGDVITVKYAWYGDSNLDGTVNINDLLALAQNYSQSGRNWAQGDLDYDGVVGFADLLKLARNYNKTLPSPQVTAAAPASETGSPAGGSEPADGPGEQYMSAPGDATVAEKSAEDRLAAELLGIGQSLLA